MLFIFFATADKEFWLICCCWQLLNFNPERQRVLHVYSLHVAFNRIYLKEGIILSFKVCADLPPVSLVWANSRPSCSPVWNSRSYFPPGTCAVTPGWSSPGQQADPCPAHNPAVTMLGISDCQLMLNVDVATSDNIKMMVCCDVMTGPVTVFAGLCLLIFSPR